MRHQVYEYINQLVTRVKAGDLGASEELCEFYQPLIRGAVTRLTRKYRQLIPYEEDLKADSYLLLIELVRGYDPDLSVFSYYLSTRVDYALLTHARRVYLDSSAGGRRTSEVSYEEMPDEWEPHATDDPFGKLIEMQALTEAIDMLNSKQREAVRLYFFEGLNQEESARACGISQSAFSKRLARALDSLKTTMQDQSQI